MTEERAAEKDRFTQACEDAISENQLVICAVTSGTQASFPSDAIPYGAGKSTLAFHLAYHLNPCSATYAPLSPESISLYHWNIHQRPVSA